MKPQTLAQVGEIAIAWQKLSSTVKARDFEYRDKLREFDGGERIGASHPRWKDAMAATETDFVALEAARRDARNALHRLQRGVRRRQP